MTDEIITDESQRDIVRLKLRDIERRQVRQANEQPAQPFDWWAFMLGGLAMLCAILMFLAAIGLKDMWMAADKPQSSIPASKYDVDLKHLKKKSEETK